MRRLYQAGRTTIVVSLVCLLLIGCGESKVVQCNKLIGVINKGQAIASAGINGNDPTAMNQLATNLEGLSQETKGVSIQDAQLKDFQTRFAQVYQTLAQASRSIANAMTTVKQTPTTGPNAAKIKQAQADAQSATQNALKAAQDENKLVTDLNSYCRAEA